MSAIVVELVRIDGGVCTAGSVCIDVGYRFIYHVEEIAGILIIMVASEWV